MPQLLLKCVKDKMYDAPKHVIRIIDLRKVVDHDPELQWGCEPRATLQIRNSDGSTTGFPPEEGFFMPSVSENAFVICYEFNEGIAIHAPEEKRILGKCQQLAESLEAKVFKI